MVADALRRRLSIGLIKNDVRFVDIILDAESGLVASVMVTAQLNPMPHISSRRSSLPMMQQLFRHSRSIFQRNHTPTEQQINQALQMMRRIPLSELGFDEKMANSQQHWQKSVGFFNRSHPPLFVGMT